MNFLPWPPFKNIRDIKLGLENCYKFLEKLGNPHYNLPPTIHIAGTNGKGSTLTYIKNILIESGFKVHCYTSPHLVKYNERIILNNQEITDKKLEYYLLRCKKIAEDFPEIKLTFFEGLTMAAILAFSEEKADYLILETGMGGRLDATNILSKVLISVITPISLDHQEFLGNNIKKIAYEKAGIIKENCPVIVGKQLKTAEKVINEMANKNNSNLIKFNADYSYKKNRSSFTLFFRNKSYEFPLPKMEGRHQIENACLAICTTLLIRNLNIDDIKRAITKTIWPARLQFIDNGKYYNILSKNSLLYIDGSHNKAGSITVRDFLKKFPHSEIIVILGMIEDKDSKNFIKNITPYTKFIITTEIVNEIKSKKKIDLYNEIKKNKFDEKNLFMSNSLDEAFDIARKLTTNNKKYLTLVTGSLYLAGQFIENNKI